MRREQRRGLICKRGIGSRFEQPPPGPSHYKATKPCILVVPALFTLQVTISFQQQPYAEVYTLHLKLIACVVFFVFKLQIEYSFGIVRKLKVKGVLYLVIFLHVI